MKKLIILTVSMVILSACTTTRVYPGQQQDRSYINQSSRACKTLEFTCPEGKQVFSDDSGCGCELIPGTVDLGGPEPTVVEVSTVNVGEETTTVVEEPVAEEPVAMPPAQEPPASPAEEPAPPAENSGPKIPAPATGEEQAAQ